MTEFFAEDLTHHAASLRRLARALLGDDDLAQDAVQQTFVKALTSGPASPAALPSWLNAVLRACAIDTARSEARRRAREQRVARPADERPALDTDERLALQLDILASVRALSEPYRTTIWLRYYEDRAPAEIASMLGISHKTVKTRLWRALHLLRGRLDHSYGRERWGVALAPIAGVPFVPACAVAGATGVAIMSGKQSAFVVAAVLCAVVGGFALWPAGTEPAPLATGFVASAREPGQPPTVPTVPSSNLDREVVAATSAADASPYGALEVHARWHDGTPAADVAITFRAEAEPRLDRNETRMVTDARGIVVAERLRAGTVQLLADRGGQFDSVVDAEARRVVEFVLARGVDVKGTVVDDLQRPVGGARVVVVSGRRGWLGGRAAASTQTDGTFLVRAVAAECSLLAEADGHRPSALLDLEQVERPAAASVVDVQLQLRGRGARLVGRVVDEQGAAVAGALVFAGAGGDVHRESSGWRREMWSGAAANTDAKGDFELGALDPGAMPFVVRADGYATHLATVTCPPAETTSITVQLQRAADVRGTVRDERGHPVAGAEILVLPAVVPEGNPEWLASLDQDAVRRPRVRSGESGEFHLEGLPVGEVHLMARARLEANTPSTTSRTTLTARPGETLRWDPVLAVGLAIRVRLVDPQGRPVLNMGPVITAVAEQSAPGAEERIPMVPLSDGQFTYVIAGCAEVPYSITVLSDRGDGRHACCRTGVMPGGPAVVIQVPAFPPELPEGTVTGRIVDGGQRLAGRPVRVRLYSLLTGRDLKVRDGRFDSSEPVAPGRYRVVVLAAEQTVAVGPWFELQPAQTLDIGDVVTTPGADVCITLRTPDGAAIDAMHGSFDGNNYDYVGLQWDGRQLTAANVTAGRHLLRLSAKDWHAAPRDVELVAGRRNEFTIDVVPAVPRCFELEFPLPGRWKRVDVTVRDGGGAVVVQQDFDGGSFGTKPYPWQRSLPLGEFTLEAVLDGLRHSWPLDLRDPAAAQPLRLSLR